MIPTFVSWRVRFTELMVDCETGLPEEAKSLCGEGLSVATAAALMSAVAKWHSSVVMLMLNDTKEPKRWG